MIDTHCHLDHPTFKNNLLKVLKEADSGGLRTIISMGTDPITSAKSLSISQKHPIVWAGIGIYPHQTDRKSESATKNQIAVINRLAGKKGVVAIGEIGLDFTNPSPEEVARSPSDQQKLFLAQLAVAQKHHLPVSIHCRKAYPEMIDILTSLPAKNRPKGVVHCFSGNRQQAKQLIGLGFALGIAGNITYSIGLVNIVKNVSLKHLVLETDAPFLAPIPQRGKPNQPAFLNYTARFVFKIINQRQAKPMLFSAFIRQIRKNTLSIFDKINLNQDFHA